jgi:hypothetical protein
MISITIWAYFLKSHRIWAQAGVSVTDTVSQGAAPCPNPMCDEFSKRIPMRNVIDRYIYKASPMDAFPKKGYSYMRVLRDGGIKRSVTDLAAGAAKR